MNTMDIFIVTFAKDFRYLIYNLRSIGKFCHEFRYVIVMCPERDKAEIQNLRIEYIDRYEPDSDAPKIRTLFFDEWFRQPHLHHDVIVCQADAYTDADLILHTDSDCIFTEDVTPDDYLVDGKPVLVYKPIEEAIKAAPGTVAWKHATVASIGFCPYETMQRHPAVHWRKTYAATREKIREHNRISIEEYIKRFPDDNRGHFCEFVALGNVAMRYFADDYHLINLCEHPGPKDHIRQAWSHQAPTKKDLAVYGELGLL